MYRLRGAPRRAGRPAPWHPALLAPQLGNARQTKQPLGFAQVAVQPDGEHDGMVAAGAALAGEDVVDDGGVQPGFTGQSRTFHAPFTQQRPQVVAAGIISCIFRIKIGFDVRAGQQSMQQLLGQMLLSHVPFPAVVIVVLSLGRCRCSL